MSVIILIKLPVVSFFFPMWHSVVINVDMYHVNHLTQQWHSILVFTPFEIYDVEDGTIKYCVLFCFGCQKSRRQTSDGFRSTTAGESFCRRAFGWNVHRSRHAHSNLEAFFFLSFPPQLVPSAIFLSYVLCGWGRLWPAVSLFTFGLQTDFIFLNWLRWVLSLF